MFPGYLEAASYDVKTHKNIHTIKGTLVGTSESNLNLQMQQLRAIHRQKQVIWIDASDQYQGELVFGKITKLSGPTLDSSKGILTAKFTIQVQELLPWGTTHTNPYSMQNGIVFRDLDGRSIGNAINPLQANCNFTSSNPGGSMAGGYFSWEFIVDNQNPFTNVTSVLEDLADTNYNGQFVSGGIGDTGNAMTLSADSSTVPNSGYNYTMKGSVSGPAASTSYGITRDFGSSGISIVACDRLRLWFRCDQAGQNTYSISAMDIWGNWREWHFSLQGANTWQQVLVSINTYSDQSATGPDFNALRYIGVFVNTASTAPSELSIWICDIRAEVGYISHCEDTSGWGSRCQIGNGYTSLEVDTTVFKNSYFGVGSQPLPSGTSAETSQLSSIKMTGTSSSSNGALGGDFSSPTGSWNISTYDFLLFWFKSDFGGQATGNLSVYLFDTYSNNFQWNYGAFTANKWYRMVLPLTKGASSGTPSLTNITNIEIISANGANNAATNLWIGEIACDNMYPGLLEFHVPDNVSQITTAINYGTWNGNSYSMGSEDPFGSAATGVVAYYLDGSTTQQDQGGTYDIVSYSQETIGTQPNRNAASGGWDPGYGPYTTTYGCQGRVGIAIKIPPATSDSSSGNLPSNDLGGPMALNKVRLKVQIYISNEDTTYTGF